jgi:predicted  nucleic acid-binding Zn-ribbon protein
VRTREEYQEELAATNRELDSIKNEMQILQQRAQQLVNSIIGLERVLQELGTDGEKTEDKE